MAPLAANVAVQAAGELAWPSWREAEALRQALHSARVRFHDKPSVE
jgi:hypothetical protein